MNSLIPEMVGAWAMEPSHLRKFLAYAAKLDELALSAAIQQRIEAGTLKAFQNLQAGGEALEPLDIRDGVAHIAISGPMMREVPSFFELLGIQATSTNEVRELLARAVEDNNVKAIQLDIDSPGGTVAGTADLGGDVAAARDLKPVYADARDLMASAAYWVGSQASRITAGATAQIGSIGVVTVVEDSSAAYAQAGIKVNVVSNHELKGIGMEGSPVTDNQLAEVKREILSLTVPFVDAVASGRRVDRSKIEALATGQVWVGAEAKALGLVDEVTEAKATTTSRGAPQTPDLRADGAPTDTGRCCDGACCQGAGGCCANSPDGGGCGCGGANGCTGCCCADNGCGSGCCGGAEGCDPMRRPNSEGAHHHPAQISLQEQDIMTKEEQEKLVAQNAALQAQLDAITAQRRADLVEKYRDRIAPSALAAVEKVGATMGQDLAGFEDFLKGMPQVTRPERLSSPAEAPKLVAGNLPALASITGIEPGARRKIGGVAGAEQAARWAGVTVEQVDRMAIVKSFRSNGTVDIYDENSPTGIKNITRAAFDKLVAA